MDLHLEGKVVVVTGGAVGIGKACVHAFLDEGCRVAVCARSADKLERLAAEYAGRELMTCQADVSRPEDMERLAAATAERFGGIDVWVNNAGMYPPGWLADMPLDLWRRTFAVNVDGVLYGARAAIPYMKRRGKGVIVNAASFAVYMPTAGRGAYGITKAAVASLTKVLGAELAPDNIRVVSYMPGFVPTDLTEETMTEYEVDAIKKQVAQNRYGRPEEIAPVVLFLASDAASFITGSGIEASGGKYCVQNPFAAWQKVET